MLISNFALFTPVLNRTIFFPMKTIESLGCGLYAGATYPRVNTVFKVSGFGYDAKNPPPLWIICLNNPFLDFSKETKYPFNFRIKNPDSDFSKETHPQFIHF